ncbi:MAG TPA: multidrug effflux MFS transporter [Azospirillum sp.]|nr:multidrug effflux MFS transporter [Azospirillum sp.]
MPVQQPKPSVILLVAATATGPLALNIFVPSMPGLPAVFGTGHATVQLTLSLYLIGVALGQLLYGPLSDRYGRRPVLLAGLGLYVAASLACALAPSIGLLILGRVAQAVGGCAGMVIARAIVRDAWDREEAMRVLALVIAGMAVAPMVAPAIGGFLDEWFGWRASFLLLAAFGGLVWLAGIRRLPETHRDHTPLPGPAALWAAYRALFGRRLFLGYALVVGWMTAGFFVFLAAAAYIMSATLHRPPSEYGLLFVLLSLGYMAGNATVSRLVGRIRLEALALAGLALSIAGPVILAGFLAAGQFSSLTLFLPTVLLCFGNGLTIPVTMSIAVGVDLRLAGTASGLLGFVQMGLGAAASSAVGVFEPGDPAVMTAGMLLTNLLALASWAYARGDREAEAEEAVRQA